MAGSQDSIIQRTAVTEWLAAGLGLLLTLSVLGYALFEGLNGEESSPELTVRAGAAIRTSEGHIVPITVVNASRATAAAVEVSGRLEAPGKPVEERRATFAYVPGEGEASGGLMFEGDPATGRLTLRAEGYEEP